MLKIMIDELEYLIIEKLCLSVSRKGFKEKFLERKKMNEKVDRFIVCVESDHNPKIDSDF